MIKRMEEQRELLKKKMNEAIDEYCDKFSEGSEQEKFTIDDIERLMLENRRKVNEIMEESGSEFASEIEAEDKKTVRNAEDI
jgi:23S rRNA pseudoU1915 N3-methylase RlmH